MRTVTTSLAALAALTALAACSTTTGGSGRTVHAAPTSRPTTSSAPATTPAQPTGFPKSTPASDPATPPTTDPATNQPASPVVHNELDAVLLSANQVGTSYARVSSPSDTSPLPCTPNDPPVVDQLRNVESGRVTFIGEAGDVQISEQIFVYGSVTEAVRHQQISERGLGCSQGTSAGQRLDIDGPLAVADQLSSSRIDKAEAWTVSNTQIGGSLVLVRIHAVIVQFAFVAKAGVSPDVSARRVVNTALHKLLQAA